MLNALVDLWTPIERVRVCAGGETFVFVDRGSAEGLNDAGAGWIDDAGRGPVHVEALGVHRAVLRVDLRGDVPVVADGLWFPATTRPIDDGDDAAIRAWRCPRPGRGFGGVGSGGMGTGPGFGIGAGPLPDVPPDPVIARFSFWDTPGLAALEPAENERVGTPSLPHRPSASPLTGAALALFEAARAGVSPTLGHGHVPTWEDFVTDDADAIAAGLDALEQEGAASGLDATTTARVLTWAAFEPSTSRARPFAALVEAYATRQGPTPDELEEGAVIGADASDAYLRALEEAAVRRLDDGDSAAVIVAALAGDDPDVALARERIAAYTRLREATGALERGDLTTARAGLDGATPDPEDEALAAAARAWLLTAEGAPGADAAWDAAADAPRIGARGLALAAEVPLLHARALVDAGDAERAVAQARKARYHAARLAWSAAVAASEDVRVTAAWELGHDEDALDALERARAAFVDAGDARGTSLAEADRAVLLAKRGRRASTEGRFYGAEVAFDDAADALVLARRSAPDDPARALIALAAARVAVLHERPAEVPSGDGFASTRAALVAEDATACARGASQAPSDRWRAWVMESCGAMAANAGDLASASRAYDDAVALRDVAGPPSGVVRARLLRGQLRAWTGDTAGALADADAASGAMGANPRLIGAAELRRAWFRALAGDLARADASLAVARRALEDQDDLPGRLQADLLGARLAVARADLLTAESTARAVATRADAGLPTLAAEAWLTVAEVARLGGRTKEGEDAVASALVDCDRAADRRCTLHARILEGALRTDAGDAEGAAAALDEALTLARELGSAQDELAALVGIGRAWVVIGRPERAVEPFGAAVEAARRTGARESFAVALAALSAVESGPAAVADARAARSAATSLGLAGPTTQLAVVEALVRAGDAKQALPEAEALVRQTETLPLANVRARTLLGRALQDLNDPRAPSALTEAFTRAKALGLPAVTWAPAYHLGVALERDAARAIEPLRAAVEALERLRFASGIDGRVVADPAREDAYLRLVSAAAHLGYVDEASRVAALLEARRAEGPLPSLPLATSDAERVALTDLTRARSRERELYEALAPQLALPIDERDEVRVAAWRAELADLAVRYEAQARAIQVKFPDLASRAQLGVGGLTQLAERLRPDEAILQPVVLPDRVVLFVVRGGGAPVVMRESIADDDLVYALTTQTRLGAERPSGSFDRGVRMSGTPPAPNPRAASRRLYDLLVAPAAADLVGVNTLIVAPSGRLRYLPFGALWDGERWLVERYDVATLTATGAVGALDPTRPGALLAFGDPDGSLPGARAEVDAIADVWPGTTRVVGAEASVAALRATAGTAPYLHVATHGFLLDDDPPASYLLLADGHLTVRDIGALDLGAVDLAVLSACQSAVGDHGDGREIAGLAYQFEARGADAVLATLWSVDDQSTKALMASFYATLPGSTRVHALAEAQRRLLADDATAQPYDWAPFVLIGDWR